MRLDILYENLIYSLVSLNRIKPSKKQFIIRSIMLLASSISIPSSSSDAEDLHKTNHNQHHEQHSKHKAQKEEAAPETFVVLDLISEGMEASVAGVGVKIAELKPKVEHINELYDNGQKHEALAKVLGISTEIMILGYCIEFLGTGELFMSAITFGSNWAWQMAQSAAGIAASSKIALFFGEKVEEATEEHYEHEIHHEQSHPKKK